MIQFLTFVKKCIYPIFGVFEGNFESNLSKRLFTFFTITVFFSYSIFFIQSIYLNIHFLSIIHIFTISMSVVSLFIFKKSNSLKLAGPLLLTSFFITSFITSYWMGEINALTLFTIVLVPILSASILSRVASALWSLSFFSLIIFFHISESTHNPLFLKISPENLTQFQILTILCLQFILLAFVNYIRSVNKKYRDLIDQQKNQKTNLVRVLSHDIATPVTVLKTCLRRLKKQSLEESVDVQRMDHAIKVISNILEHVRELEAISSGKKEMVLQKVNMLDIFDELKQLHQQSIDSKQISFKVEYRNLGGNFHVLADRRGLSYQVLNNLISNAIKFTDSGGTILVLLESTPLQTTCTIKDSGVGMPKEIVENLFSDTEKTTRTGTQGEKGTGFGMPIVKNYIERFQGKIEVQSSLKESNLENHGTTVTITLPNAS